MTKAQKDNLFQLIKSLSKSEKRQFKLYVGRLGVNTDSKFLNLLRASREAVRLQALRPTPLKRVASDVK